MKKGWLFLLTPLLLGNTSVRAVTTGSSQIESSSQAISNSESASMEMTTESSEVILHQAPAAAPTQEKLQIQDLYGNQEMIRVSYLPSSGESYRGMKFPVWTQDKGQDDIQWAEGKWFAGEKRWIADIPVKSHASAGKLNIHAYGVRENGSLIGCGGSSIELAAPDFSAEVLSADQNNTRFTVKVTINSAASPIKEVRVPIWSDPQQRDLVWYRAVLQTDGTYVAQFDYKNHNFNSGSFKTHVYVTQNNGITKAISIPSTIVAQPQITSELQVTSLTPNQQSYRVSLKLNTSVKSVQFPIWSSKNGQDDIRWYQGRYDESSDSWYVDFRPSDHKDFNEFYIHAYYDQGRGLKFGGATSLQLAQPKFLSATVDKTATGEGKFRVLLQVQSDAGIKELRVPIWSRSDQKDIKWYQAVRQSDGSYAVDFDYAEHDYQVGVYHVHAYLTAGNGLQTVIPVDNQVKVSEPKITGDFSVENSNGQFQNYRIKVKLSGQVKNVLFPTWSEPKGQDDIKWYSGRYDEKNQLWYADVPIKDHRDAGKLIVHTYYQQGKNLKFVTADSFTVPRPTFKDIDIDTSKANQGKIRLRFNLEVPAGLKELRVPIWSKADQSDIVWYQAKQQTDGTYQVEMDFKNHHYHTGKYLIHAYITDNNGASVGKVVSNGIDVSEPKLTADNVDIQDISGNGSRYQLSVKLSKIPEKIKQVLFPVWSDQRGQDDIRWYQGKYDASKDKWQTIVETSHHRDGQKLIVHLYADVEEKGMLGLKATSIQLPDTQVMKYINHRGNHSHAPENSLPAFENSNYWGIETDIQLTKDRRWVIMHDDTVDRMTNGSGRIADLTFRQLRNFRFDNGANVNSYPDDQKVIPTLEEYLIICRNHGKVPIIEIKTNQINAGDYDSLASIIRQYGFTKEARFISFYLEPLRQIKARIPELQTLYLTSDINSETIQQAKSIGNQSGLNIIWTSVNSQKVQQAQQNGLTTGAWTVPMSVMSTMREAGVGYLTTDE